MTNKISDLELQIEINNQGYRHELQGIEDLDSKYGSLQADAVLANQELLTSYKTFDEIIAHQGEIFTEILARFRETTDRFAAGSTLDPTKIAQYTQRTKMYQEALQDDPELAKSLEPLALEAEKKLASGASEETLEAGVLVWHAQDTLELYVSVPYAGQREGPAQYVTQTVMESLLVHQLKVENPLEQDGFLRLNVYGEVDIEGLVESLHDLQPEELGEANVSLTILSIEDLTLDLLAYPVAGNGKVSRPPAEPSPPLQPLAEIGRLVDEIPEGYIRVRDTRPHTGRTECFVYKHLAGREGNIPWVQMFIPDIGRPATFVEVDGLQKCVQHFGGKLVYDEISPEERKKYITVQEARAITGFDAPTVYGHLDTDGGPIVTAKPEGERLLDRQSLESFLEKKYGPLEMHTMAGAAEKMYEMAQEKLPEADNVPTYLRLLRQKEEEGTLKTLIETDGTHVFSENEFSRVYVKYFAEVMAEKFNGEAISRPDVMNILSVSRGAVSRMIADGRLTPADKKKTLVTSDSVKNFASRYHFTGTSWMPPRRSPR